MGILYDMSTTDASNTAFAGISQAENVMKPSDVNNSFRAHDGAQARWLADEGAVNTVAGTGDVITVTLSQPFTGYYVSGSTTALIQSGALIRFIASAANTTNVTINVNTIGAKAIRKTSGGTDVALVAGDLVAGETYTMIYRSTANAAAGAWVLIGAAAIAAATTSASGIVELATVAEALTGTDAVRAVTPAGLYYPTGHLFGLTLTTNAGDATNDVDIAAGDARSDDDTANMVLATALGKQLDVAWAVGGTTGSTKGMLATGSAVANSRYFLFLIKRPDTSVVDFAADTSSTGANIATNTNANYTLKVLVGEVTRAGGVNGTPIWYGASRTATLRAGINLGIPVASTSGTSIDFTGIPVGVKRVTVMFFGMSTSGTSTPVVRIGAGSVVATGYASSAGVSLTGNQTGAANDTTGFLVTSSTAAAAVFYGTITLDLVNATTNAWVATLAMARSDTAIGISGGGGIALSGLLDRVRITTLGGTDTFDLGTVNISYE